MDLQVGKQLAEPLLVLGQRSVVQPGPRPGPAPPRGGRPCRHPARRRPRSRSHSSMRSPHLQFLSWSVEHWVPAATLRRDQPAGGHVPISGPPVPPGLVTTPPGSSTTGAISHARPGDQELPHRMREKGYRGRFTVIGPSRRPPGRACPASRRRRAAYDSFHGEPAWHEGDEGVGQVPSGTVLGPRQPVAHRCDDRAGDEHGRSSAVDVVRAAWRRGDGLLELVCQGEVQLLARPTGDPQAAPSIKVTDTTGTRSCAVGHTTVVAQPRSASIDADVRCGCH
ncbi:hypothetical protein SAMN05660209_04382 [Geodermatophilus africanus]|uniref:Uncharacterized protein n=1 Tax=Geodermatophilus africanus TaxID=1137993 RepID=A0A1H3PLA8_9ACTN|nr:hypothetical protein SAMN05660209_04382 [Geodermatophilus africanus]